jgi:hypothetical protein
VLRAAQVGAGEARADLEALAGGQAHHGLREVGLQAIEHRLAPARRAAAHRAGDDAAERVALLARRLDGGDHPLGHREIRAADRRAIDRLARDALRIARR